MNESQLLKKAKRLDERALAEIYDRYSDGLFRYAVRLLGSRDTAEECVAETFSRLLHALHAGKGPTNYLRAYLYRTAHNWSMDAFRRQATLTLEEERLAQESDLGGDVDAVWRAAAVRRALIALTPDQRQVIMLKFYEGWRNKEIAAALGKPVGAVKSLQHRALAALERQFAAVEELNRP